jgi:hypothetical protein
MTAPDSSSATATLRAPRALPVVPGAHAPVGPKGEARKSNEVDGFVYKRWRAIAYTLGLVLKLPLLPLWPIFIAREAKDWSIARRYFRTLAYCFGVVWQQVRFGSVWRLIKYNILLGPDEVKRRISVRRGACTRCAKCCQQFSCIFLGKDKKTSEFYCKVYQTDYWYYGTCGRYPLDQWDIDSHSCPGFSFEVEDTQPARKAA